MAAAPAPMPVCWSVLSPALVLYNETSRSENQIQQGQISAVCG